MARRIAAAATREIPAESVEAYWRQWDEPAFAEDVDQVPAGLLDEYECLEGGMGHLRLSDRSRWVMAQPY